ncbi:DUF4350 domain-containing protein [Flavobacterium amniphilum]|uniref:DUF4350 domain-containing protein n=1 Tax=Flavobacterium amniphilum TaxID=1834035 RepID=UPI00202AA46F|nr:DUF4350 domain-containing protein [Flavobacterium amniphilum]MCL9805630.1 DUF4350 domain-containing protein [Flavobacterium amniphilum]
MNKNIIIYIVLLVLLIIGISFIESADPKPVDWTPSYDIKDKRPLGLYVFNAEIKGLLKKSKIEKIKQTPYSFFTESYNYDTINPGYTKKGTFLYIDEFSNLNEEEVNEMLTYVSYGNKAFISAKDFPKNLMDSLSMNQTSEYNRKGAILNGIYNKSLGNTEYKIEEDVTLGYFSKIDYDYTTALGYVRQDTAKINFVKVNYYDGEIYLHKQPAAFTNFHLLKENHYQYAEKVLSYVPEGNVYWYTKGQIEGESSLLKYFLSQPAFRAATYIFLIGMLLFMIFNAKRKQRIVPIFKPLTNTTIDFVKSIGNLYHQEGNHDNIIDKKIIYFLEKIRNEYLMDTTKLDDQFIRKLHQKSGKDIQVIEKAVFLINAHRRSPNTSIEADLIQISNAIENVLHKD